MGANGYKDLIVWQKSIALITMAYKILAKFPKEEMFGLTSQMKRSSCSIPANIAEGWARGTDKYFVQFLFVAKGSLAEFETQVEIANNLGFLSSEDYNNLMAASIEIGRMLNSLIKSIKKKDSE